MKITRKWDMPNSNTFDVPCISEFVKSYIRESDLSIDPFARNKRLASVTNDLNPDTQAEFHFEAGEFLAMQADLGNLYDLGLYDPPYSPRQISECYQSIGMDVSQEDTQSGTWAAWKRALNNVIKPGGTVLSFGWNSVGMGKVMGYEIVEIMLVCHGGMHNDTICVAERKIAAQLHLGV